MTCKQEQCKVCCLLLLATVLLFATLSLFAVLLLLLFRCLLFFCCLLHVAMLLLFAVYFSLLKKEYARGTESKIYRSAATAFLAAVRSLFLLLS